MFTKCQGFLIRLRYYQMISGSYRRRGGGIFMPFLLLGNPGSSSWVFSECFHWIHWIQWQKIFVITVKGLEPAALCARDQDANTRVTDRIVKFLHQWFARFTEFAEFTEFLFYLGKTPMTILTPSFDENKRHQVVPNFLWQINCYQVAVQFMACKIPKKILCCTWLLKSLTVAVILPSANKLREGNVFSDVCLSLCPQVERGCSMWSLPMMHWTPLYMPPAVDIWWLWFKADGTHPTGMLSCRHSFWLKCRKLFGKLNCEHITTRVFTVDDTTGWERLIRTRLIRSSTNSK